MPLPYVRAWLKGAQKRYLAQRRFYGEVLAAIMWLGGERVNPEDLYPTKTLEDKIEELMRNGRENRRD